MNRPPRQPLDAQERAVLARLPRPHGRGEPGAGVDARILAAARAAPATAPTRAPRRRWIASLGVAAAVIVAAGLAWQLQPPPAPPETGGYAAIEPPAPQAAAIAEPAAPAADAVAQPSPTAAAPLQPTPVRKRSPTAAATASAPMAETNATEPAPPPPPALQAAPVTAAAETMDVVGITTTGAARPQAADTQRAVAMPRPAARSAGDPERDATVRADVAEDDVPPATVDAPGVREAWLRRIGQLVAEGRLDEARESLAVFRERYPDATLPPELQALEPSPGE